ncbi:hypothetical protein ABLU29_06935 [Lactococcus lactis]|uniref:hypothetical protein n=1 Tax=Lactococcus lactis TaxID=1358 RepID=UPI0038780F0D
MKKIILLFIVVIPLIANCVLPLSVNASGIKEGKTNYSGVFYETNFDKGLAHWSYNENVTIQQKNGNNYALLSGYTDCDPIGPCRPVLAMMQLKLGGAKPGATYTFSIKAIGIGKIAVNSSSYQISVDDGSAALDIDNAKTYSTTFTADNEGKIQITILGSGTKIAVDDVKINN